MNGKPIDLPELQVTTIDVNFDTGIYKPRLDSMLLNMVVVKFCNKLIESFNLPVLNVHISIAV